MDLPTFSFRMLALSYSDTHIFNFKDSFLVCVCNPWLSIYIYEGTEWLQTVTRIPLTPANLLHLCGYIFTQQDSYSERMGCRLWKGLRCVDKQESIWSIWAENRQVARNPHNYQSKEKITLEEQYNSLKDWAAAPSCPLHACGEISCTQFSTALVFGPTAPLNPPWEDLSLCLNVLGSHVSFTYPSSTLGSWMVWLVLLSWKQYCSSLLRQLVFHALVCGSVVSAPKECLPSGSGIHTSKVNFYC